MPLQQYQRASLRVTDMPDLQVITAILSHPEVRGQSRDQGTKSKVQVLNPGYPLLEHHNLHDDIPGHDGSRHHRREYAHFVASEDRYGGQERTPPYATCHHQPRDGG